MSSSIQPLQLPVDLLQHRPTPYELTVYQSDNETPRGIAALDKVRFRMWKTKDATAALSVDDSAIVNGCSVTINDRGATGTTPAKVTVLISAAAVDLFTSADTVFWEAAVLVNAESNNPYVFTRGQFTIIDNCNA